MCQECKKVVAAGGCAKNVDFRNAIVPGKHSSAPDEDHGPGTSGHAAVTVTKESIDRYVQGETLRYQSLMKDMTFDYSHPVDEYAPIGNPGPQQSLTVQSDYDMPERIEHITCVIPVGATSATLQLGPRYLQLYSSVSSSAPVPSQPAVPASGVAQQNTNTYPVSVVVSAGTLTNVAVNGVTVGTGDGTYLVPAGGAISITYSVAPTWVWSNASPAASSGLAAPLNVTIHAGGIILNSDDIRQVVFSGLVTSQPYLGLAGWALTRGQFS